MGGGWIPPDHPLWVRQWTRSSSLEAFTMEFVVSHPRLLDGKFGEGLKTQKPMFENMFFLSNQWKRENEEKRGGGGRVFVWLSE